MIVEFRASVHALLDRDHHLPVSLYAPDDVTLLPCLVVGAPTVRESRTPGVSTLSLPVYVLGRRLGDDDSQAELDTEADLALSVLGGSKSRQSGSATLRCVSATPGVTTVAGADVPTYVLAVEAEYATC